MTSGKKMKISFAFSFDLTSSDELLSVNSDTFCGNELILHRDKWSNEEDVWQFEFKVGETGKGDLTIRLLEQDMKYLEELLKNRHQIKRKEVEK